MDLDQIERDLDARLESFKRTMPPPRPTPPPDPLPTQPASPPGEAATFATKQHTVSPQGLAATEADIDRRAGGYAKLQEAGKMPPGPEREAIQAQGSLESEGRSSYLSEGLGPFHRLRQPMPLDYQTEFGEKALPRPLSADQPLSPSKPESPSAPTMPESPDAQMTMPEFFAKRLDYWMTQFNGDQRRAVDHAQEDVRQLQAVLKADQGQPTVGGLTAQPMTPRVPQQPGVIPPQAGPPPGPEPIPGLGQLRQAPQGGALAPVMQQAMQPQPGPMGVGDVVSHVLDKIAESALGATGGIVKNVGITARFINDAVSGHGGELDDYATFKVGTAIEQYAKLNFPGDSRAQASFLMTAVPRAFGAGMVFMAGGLGGRMASSAGTLGALGMGAQGQQEAEAAGADQVTQAKAMLFGGVIGATNAIPWQTTLAAVDKATGGAFKKAVIGGGVQAGMAWVQQMVQTGAMNGMAQQLYEANREIFDAAGLEGANANAIAGIVLGSLVGAARSQLKLRQDVFREEQPTSPNKTLTDQPLMAAESKVPTPSAGQPLHQQTDLAGAPPTPKPSGPPAVVPPPPGAVASPPAPAAEAPNVPTAQNSRTESGPIRSGNGASVPRGVAPEATQVPENTNITEAEPAWSTNPETPVFITPRDRQLASAGEPIQRARGPQDQTLDQLLSPPPPHEVANIQAVPMEGNVKPDNIREIIKRATSEINIPVRVGHVPGQAGGYYHAAAGGIRIKDLSDIGGTAHELAHGLDDHLHLISGWVDVRAQSPFDNELKPFWSGGRASEPPPGLSPLERLKYHRQEGVAEWFRSYLINPNETMRRSPEFTAYIHATVPPETLATMNRIGTDQRAFLNASAHDVMMANIEWTPPKSDFLRLSRDPDKFQITAYDHWKTEMTDRLHPYIKAIEFAKQVGGKKLLAKDDPEISVRLLSGGHAKMDDTVAHGIARPNTSMLDQDYRMTGPLSDVIPKGADKAEIDDKMQNVATYMFAQRSVEKAGQLGHEIMSWGAGMEPSQAVVAKRLQEFERLPDEQKAEIEHYAGKYREWADANLQVLVEKGRMSPQLYKAIKDSNQYYIAMQRLAEVNPEEPVIGRGFGAGSGELGVKKEVVHKLVGSNKQIHNPYDSLLEATYRTQREADRNDAMRQFVDLLEVPRPMHQKEGGVPTDVKALAQLGQRWLGKGKPENMDNTITVFRKGEPEYWQLQPDVYEALTRTNGMEYHLPGWMTLGPRAMRQLIINAPPFQIRNFIRDMSQRAVVSDVGSHPASSFPALGDLWGDRFLPDNWKPDLVKGTLAIEQGGLAQAGGAQAGTYFKDRQSYHKMMEHAVHEVAADKRFLLLDPERMGTAVKDFMQTGEAAGRLAEFRAAYAFAEKQGMDPVSAQVYAASKTRGVMDFAQMGRTVRMLNQVMPFTAASIRGPLRALEAARDHPALFARQWGLYVLAPVLANKAWNYAMGDDEEARKLPGYRKDLFTNWKVGADHWLSIPQPFELGVMASGVSRGLDAAFAVNDTGSFGKELARAYEGWPHSLWKSLVPFDESTLAALPILPGLQETISNWDNFRGRHIVPPEEEERDLDLRKRAKRGSSRLGQAVSDSLVKAGVAIDPRNVDHFIKRQFGYAGLYAEALSDVGREDKKGMTTLQALGLGTADPIWSNPDVEWVTKRAKGRGVRTSKSGDGARLKQIYDLEHKYESTKDPQERDAITKDLIQTAKELRSRWEETAPKTQPRKKSLKRLQSEAGLAP